MTQGVVLVFVPGRADQLFLRGLTAPIGEDVQDAQALPCDLDGAAVCQPDPPRGGIDPPGGRPLLGGGRLRDELEGPRAHGEALEDPEIDVVEGRLRAEQSLGPSRRGGRHLRGRREMLEARGREPIGVRRFEGERGLQRVAPRSRAAGELVEVGGFAFEVGPASGAEQCVAEEHSALGLEERQLVAHAEAHGFDGVVGRGCGVARGEGARRGEELGQDLEPAIAGGGRRLEGRVAALAGRADRGPGGVDDAGAALAEALGDRGWRRAVGAGGDESQLHRRELDVGARVDLFDLAHAGLEERRQPVELTGGEAPGDVEVVERGEQERRAAGEGADLVGEPARSVELAALEVGARAQEDALAVRQEHGLRAAGAAALGELFGFADHAEDQEGVREIAGGRARVRALGAAPQRGELVQGRRAAREGLGEGACRVSAERVVLGFDVGGAEERVRLGVVAEVDGAGRAQEHRLEARPRVEVVRGEDLVELRGGVLGVAAGAQCARPGEGLGRPAAGRRVDLGESRGVSQLGGAAQLPRLHRGIRAVAEDLPEARRIAAAEEALRVAIEEIGEGFAAPELREEARGFEARVDGFLLGEEGGGVGGAAVAVAAAAAREQAAGNVVKADAARAPGHEAALFQECEGVGTGARREEREDLEGQRDLDERQAAEERRGVTREAGEEALFLEGLLRRAGDEELREEPRAPARLGDGSPHGDRIGSRRPRAGEGAELVVAHRGEGEDLAGELRTVRARAARGDPAALARVTREAHQHLHRLVRLALKDVVDHDEEGARLGEVEGRGGDRLGIGLDRGPVDVLTGDSGERAEDVLTNLRRRLTGWHVDEDHPIDLPGEARVERLQDQRRLADAPGAGDQRDGGAVDGFGEPRQIRVPAHVDGGGIGEAVGEGDRGLLLGRALLSRSHGRRIVRVESDPKPNFRTPSLSPSGGSRGRRTSPSPCRACGCAGASAGWGPDRASLPRAPRGRSGAAPLRG